MSKIVICEDSDKELHIVDCSKLKITKNKASMMKVARYLGRNYPELSFVGWSVDPNDEEDVSFVKEKFENANIAWVKVWEIDENNIPHKKLISREEIE